ncbi:unnamed protein product [Nippostrongylus brasiliensis]|uniref:Lytic transglycosylase n=1 Tax=Nippostrongylus brasiliensis TaxID=27835 RepID=A0A0N4YQP2_NIPBR|nr:unnamed protein product [Nippostrongylus brasiliensis]
MQPLANSVIGFYSSSWFERYVIGLMRNESELYPMGDYRLASLGDYVSAHKRVPSAGDMMVRFGKRSV